jgi:peptidoglycan hydrolase-like protein with peptidoglycan-binding domain
MAFNLWHDLGFTQNPYSQETLPATADGDALLTGRQEPLEDIQQSIGSEGSYPSIEGPIGCGKTSLLNVAIYRMKRRAINDRAGYLWLPTTSTFQLDQSTDEFESKVYRVVLQTLIENASHFAEVGLNSPDIGALNTWLNRSVYTNRQAGASVLGNGGNLGGGQTPTETDGFTHQGFADAVRRVLSECFPKGTGGIVCILDNLEILGTSGEARDRLDELRDRVFNIDGLRWVLVGARGMVSRARIQRLSGIFAAPLQVGVLEDDAAIEAVRARIDYYGNVGAIAPVTPQAFKYIYDVLHQNLRDAMSEAQAMSKKLAKIYKTSDRFPSDEERDELIKQWLADAAEAANKDANNLQPRAWQLFMDIAAAGGRAGSSEWQTFSLASPQQFSGYMTQFLNANLIARESDPDDGKKVMNVVTALGWLVYHHRTRAFVPAGNVQLGSPAARELAVGDSAAEL